MAVDLFCGAGGLTRGLLDAGLNVAVGVDVDPTFKHAYETNNSPAHFIARDVGALSADELRPYYGSSGVRVLAGCAPCQPFSTLTQGRPPSEDGRWPLLDHFRRLAEDLRPDVVTMENVPALLKNEIYARFRKSLEDGGYHVWAAIVDCANYGVPQRRRRLVLLASRFGPISLMAPTSPEGKRPTVRDAIAGLPTIDAGQAQADDPLHRSAGLSKRNARRLQASRPGGTWRDWARKDQLACHKKESGKSYQAVYGRMEWDAPAPTITTQAYNLGSGRFGHPEQDRAISLREAALLQTFPLGYQFLPLGTPITLKAVGTMIGNAVPVKLGQAIGETVRQHIELHLPRQLTPKPVGSRVRDWLRSWVLP